MQIAGYKWLKYVPNGLLKAAQGAEWKIQAWMLGKPPTIQYKGIGYSMPTSAAATSAPHSSPSLSSTSTSMSSRKRSTKEKGSRPGTAQLVSSPITPTQARPSTASSPKNKRSGSADGRPSMSSVFSDYDDLRDFDGRFDSRSTLGRPSTSSNPRVRASSEARRPGIPRKPSRGFLGIGGMLSKNTSHSPTSFTPPGHGQSAATAPSSPVVPPARRPALKALRSMGSLRGRSNRGPQTQKVEPEVEAPPAPLKLDVDVGLGLDEDGWMDTVRAKYAPRLPSVSPVRPGSGHGHGGTRDGGRRSISLTGGAPLTLERSRERERDVRGKERESEPASPGITASSAYQAALGNALIAASHAEAHARGTHADLLAILNHTGAPWGFSYAQYPHAVRVWYGDRDEKIAEHAVRWMEKEMIGGGRGGGGGRGRCEVKVVKGADHGLMYRSSVVVEVFELVRDAWGDADGDADAGMSLPRFARAPYTDVAVRSESTTANGVDALNHSVAPFA